MLYYSSIDKFIWNSIPFLKEVVLHAQTNVTWKHMKLTEKSSLNSNDTKRTGIFTGRIRKTEAYTMFECLHKGLDKYLN